jgi:hypothetical protein
MNADLEKTVEELGPGYRDVVARLRAAREVEPARFGLKDLAPGRAAPWCAARSPFSYLAAASLVAALALAVLYVMPRGGSTAAEVPLTVYTVAYAPTEEALELILASQRADGSWSNDFLTRQNAAALRASGDERMRVAYRRAVRYLRTKGLAPLTDAELKARGEYAAKSRFGA